ncbi:MAG: hypothetical protein PHY95_03725 [Candidatus ainarchaeum sp.]|nr:hypothetical protein [Candidatus ainarchaeum sp.]
MQTKPIFLGVLLLSAFLLFGCGQQPGYQAPVSGSHAYGTGNPAGSQPAFNPAAYPTTTREESLPGGAVKVTVDSDIYPPILHSDEFTNPVPLGLPVDTLGAEDSPFIMPDGNTLYVWFTPDPNMPVEQQLFDNVTGIYEYHKVGAGWGEPTRIWLNEPGVLSLDGCLFVQGDTAWFCSAREGYAGMNLFIARYVNGKWADWQYAGDTLKDYEAGELHISADGSTMYFHSGRAGGKGGLDIWSTQMVDGHWSEPVNFEIMNSPDNEGWPFISQDGNEFWFTRFYQGGPALFRSKNVSGEWTEPELIISQFAGEPTLDNEGNLYFTHHFYENNTMIEADIYVAYRR